jgi:TonB family protein
MRRELAAALLSFLLPTHFAAAQQPAAPSDPTAPTQANEPMYTIGGRISAPQIKHRVTAQFTDEARRAHYQGVCLVALIVDAQGNPQNVHIARALGMGLDEKALAAVRQYRFKPALRDRKTPVPVAITIQINFRLD